MVDNIWTAYKPNLIIVFVIRVLLLDYLIWKLVMNWNNNFKNEDSFLSLLWYVLKNITNYRKIFVTFFIENKRFL